MTKQLSLFGLTKWEPWHIDQELSRQKEQESAQEGWELLRQQEQAARARTYQLRFVIKETPTHV